MGRKTYRLSPDWSVRIRLKKEGESQNQDPSHFAEYTHGLEISLVQISSGQRFSSTTVPWKEVDHPKRVFWNAQREMLDISGESQLIHLPLSIPLGLAARIELARDQVKGDASKTILQSIISSQMVENRDERFNGILVALNELNDLEDLAQQIHTLEENEAGSLLRAIVEVVRSLLEIDGKSSDCSSMHKVIELGSMLLDVWGLHLLNDSDLLPVLLEFDAFLKHSIALLEAGRNIQTMCSAQSELRDKMSKSDESLSPYSIEILYL